jgi:hypothetical protein
LKSNTIHLAKALFLEDVAVIELEVKTIFIQMIEEGYSVGKALEMTKQLRELGVLSPVQETELTLLLKLSLVSRSQSLHLH